MPTPAIEAGTAAPTPAAVALPCHSLSFENAPAIAVGAVPAGRMEALVLLGTHVGQVPRRLTPAEARQLAVYLVDCANALDNPAARVIVDDTPAWPLKPCQDMGAPRARVEGEGA